MSLFSTNDYIRDESLMVKMIHHVCVLTSMTTYPRQRAIFTEV